MTPADFQKNFNIPLNRQQMDAVRHTEGPALLLAVPGSGKTTVLIARLGYMIYCAGIQPEQILTLTYTVAATRDMADRFQSCFGPRLRERLEFRTINGICARIIYFYGRLIGKSSYQLVTDEKFISGLLSSIYQREENGYPAENDIKSLRTLITYIKNMMLTQEEILELDEEAELHISRIYRVYCDEMRRQGLMDYDDQMAYALNILRRSPETLQHFQDQYRYLCVDEAQDTSRIQHELIALLAGSRRNLFMVGDEDQSIYGFRAAYPQALLSFEQNFPGAQLLLMEENFRSNARIVEAADRFIQRNMLRHEKHMKAFREAGSQIREIELKSRKAQYTYLAKVAADCRTQTAVLYRDNESVLPLVDQLERNGTPYQMRNGELTFFTHRVVMDIRNIIRFALNPRDTELFLQIYYKMNLYLNKQEAADFALLAGRKQLPVLEAAVESGQAAVKTIGNIRAMQENLEALLEDNGEQAVSRIIKLMGYGNYLERAKLNDGKIFILKSIASCEPSAERFLERLEELQEIVKGRENDPGCPFILSTIHASKGLEYDTVYLIDVADGIFPEKVPERPKGLNNEGRKQMGKGAEKRAEKWDFAEEGGEAAGPTGGEEAEWAAYEEERRIFYVGVTRAKDHLNLFKLPAGSTFLRELFGGKRKDRMSADRGVSARFADSVTGVKSGTDFNWEEFNAFCSSLGEGVAVRHKKYGPGAVVELAGDYVTVQFQEARRTLALRIVYEKGLLTADT